jgi:heme oxygenase
MRTVARVRSLAGFGGTMILARLKSRTARLHDEIEGAVDVFRPGFGAEDYRALLARFLGFYEPLEDRLAHVADPDFRTFFEPRRKAGLLREDLRALGLDPSAIEHLPRCHDLPSCRGLADALGIAYVVEGATLGGKLVAGHVERTIGAGASFFRPYGERLGAMWEEFRAMAERREAEVDPEEVVASACATFERLGAWLERPS